MHTADTPWFLLLNVTCFVYLCPESCEIEAWQYIILIMMMEDVYRVFVWWSNRGKRKCWKKIYIEQYFLKTELCDLRLEPESIRLFSS